MHTAGPKPFLTQGRSRNALFAVAAVLVAGVAIAAWTRVGLLDLASVPGSISLQEAGLSDLEQWRELDDYLRADPALGLATPSPSIIPGDLAPEVIELGRRGILSIAASDAVGGLEILRQSVSRAPDNLVIGNAYRMEVFRLRRDFLRQSRSGGTLIPQFPPHLDAQPITYFQMLAKDRPSREVQLQLALSWVDEMLLFPALEIKAPSSVQAVDILTTLIEQGGENYVPALFARGLNHLHRPARLVWPETNTTPKDAAVQDIARCVAIGRKLGAGSRHLQATLAMTLGDAYVKAGRNDVARSWWQIAQNLSHEEGVQSAVRRRYSWSDEEILDRLEQELDRARQELEHPMTDLALMWSD